MTESLLTYSKFELVAWGLHTIQQCLLYQKSTIICMEAIYCIHSFSQILKRVEIFNHYFFQYQKDGYLFPTPLCFQFFWIWTYVYYVDTLIKRKNKPVFSLCLNAVNFRGLGLVHSMKRDICWIQWVWGPVIMHLGLHLHRFCCRLQVYI